MLGGQELGVALIHAGNPEIAGELTGGGAVRVCHGHQARTSLLRGQVPLGVYSPLGSGRDHSAGV
jgi:hypothetical protein